MDDFINRLTGSVWFGYLARVGVTFMYWSSGLAKLADFSAAKAEMAFFGLAPAGLFAVAVIATQLIGSALIIANRYAWLGAGMLAVFTALTIPVAHHFWTMEEPLRTIEFYVVMEHITMIGAMMVVAWKTAR